MEDFDLTKTLRQGIFQLNLKNLTNTKTWEEAVEIMEAFLRNVKREKDIKKKASSLNFLMWSQGLGNMISKQGFLEILNHVELTLIQFEIFVKERENPVLLGRSSKEELELSKKHFKKIAEMEFKWFYDLKNG